MFSPLDILVAEHERALASSILSALKCDGHRVRLVADGRQALSSVRRESGRFDALIVDDSVPGISGPQLVHRFRTEFFPGLVIVLSANLTRENRAGYELLGVDALVAKPFDVHGLRATITRLAHGMNIEAKKQVWHSPAGLHELFMAALEEDPSSRPEGRR